MKLKLLKSNYIKERNEEFSKKNLFRTFEKRNYSILIKLYVKYRLMLYETLKAN